MSQIHQYPLLILEEHVDSLGHMNNATYLQLFEQARWDLITSRGYGFSYIQKVKQGPVILEVNLKFLSEVHLRDHVTIVTELIGYPKKVGQLSQKMLKADQTLAAEAIFTFGLFDMRERKLIEPTAEWKLAVGSV